MTVWIKFRCDGCAPVATTQEHRTYRTDDPRIFAAILLTLLLGRQHGWLPGCESLTLA
jgi:hypothetical protein